MKQYTFIKKASALLFTLLMGCVMAGAQEAQTSQLQQAAETAAKGGSVASARYNYIRAYEDYAGKGQLQQAVECGTKATALYYKENYYKEAFDLLRRIDQNINAKATQNAKAALHYLTTKERLQMYIKLKKSESAKEQIRNLEGYANASGDANIGNDLLYTKAIYYYTFGMNAQGNAVFKEMADKLTADKQYDKVEDVYKTLIANGNKSGNANMLAQTYKNYMAWKDSVSVLKKADEMAALQQQIADNEAVIADKESAITARQAIIVVLGIVSVALAAVLIVGAIVLLRYMALSRKQKKTIKQANDSNAQKAKFINNISAQLEPTLKKLDSRIPEVKALLDFSGHVQLLSELENTDGSQLEFEDTAVPPFCEKLMDGIRNKVKPGVTLTVNAPNQSVKINQQYVAHILSHLLDNAAAYTPENGKITLEYKKRGAHAHQFLVTDTGEGISEERREEVFLPFREVKDLTTGDGLGLPICRQMARHINGDLDIDPAYTKGTRMVLGLHI